MGVESRKFSGRNDLSMGVELGQRVYLRIRPGSAPVKWSGLSIRKTISYDMIFRMPIQVIEPRRLYLQIADQVRSLIAAGEFSPGSRLPAERELAKQFGVSRPSMREALIALEVEGYVEVRPGSGIIVTTSNRAGLRTVRVKKDRWKSCGFEASLREQSPKKPPLR